ncbi:cobalt-precorrin-8X methylmutase [Gloeocapsa sp. PCC 73106]|uniref:cobalt-precorrin-8X methylmutase n=1 Tax=Gloeocapsa sp. PCC 73106 TaxID=102232 RepID=UPI000558FF31|nr:cobalt-precorrin-8X methylmutase [Gloeocapsa sp. PCC 73106]
MSELNHPILQESFEIIDREIGQHSLSLQEYAIARRVIHATADFDFLDLLKFSPEVIEIALDSLSGQTPIITDVTMVQQGIKTLVTKTFNNPLISAVDQIEISLPGKTRTETGILQCYQQYPRGIYVIGNAPTALLALCSQIEYNSRIPALIIGAPVGFVKVIEAKEALTMTKVPYILVQGRKGGSPVASAIVNALLILAAEKWL